jgi:SulP family sulfate permease
MEKAGFLDRIGRENVCPHIDAALARSREILGLPPALPIDPHHEEKQRLEAARQELASVLAKIQDALNPPSANNRMSSRAEQPPAIVGNGDGKKN